MEPVDDDNRRAPRMRSLIGAKIVFNSGGSVLDCVVRNLSTTGARLQIENALSAPSVFELAMSDGRHMSCTVMWRKAGAIGVHFVGRDP